MFLVPSAMRVLSLMWLSLWLIGEASAKRPNVVLFLTDDQGYGDVRSHGNEWIDTPVHDRLAAEGARFDRFYVNSACAMTRAALLTGRYYLRTGVHGVTRGYEVMRAEEETMAEILRDAGYKTGCFGKWHNGASFPTDPNGQGFEEFYGFCAGHWNEYQDTHYQHNQSFVKEKGFMVDVLTDKAMEFIAQHHNEPFFCYIPYQTPHTPWQAPEKYWQKYKAMLDAGKLKTAKEACAYAMVENIDWNMGRVMAKLEELGLTENTIVLFTTDNGANADRYNAGMRGRKGSVHEGGMRVPLFVKYPKKVKAGLEIRPITSHFDLLPTLAEWCGVKLSATQEEKLDGVSLVPLLEKQEESVGERYIFAHHPSGSPTEVEKFPGGVRSQKFRAVHYGDRVVKKWGSVGVLGGGWGLYDMEKDPSQKVNVAKEHPEILKEMAQAYDVWFKDVTRAGFDPIGIPVGHAEAPEVRLRGHDAQLSPASGQGISYSMKQGWSNDWIANWTNQASFAWWPLEVKQAGKHEVWVDYNVSQGEEGDRFELVAGEHALSFALSEVFAGEEKPTTDRIPRKEVFERSWKRVKVGELEVAAGVEKLKLHLRALAGDQAARIKQVTLKAL